MVDADQRYYASTYGRFVSPDPYRAMSASVSNPASPQSWNKYAYSLNDPIGLFDPKGLQEQNPDESDGDEEPPQDPPRTLPRPIAQPTKPTDCTIELHYRPVDPSSTILQLFSHTYLYAEDEYGNTFVTEWHEQHDFTLSGLDFWGQLIVQVYPLGPYTGNTNQSGGYKNDDHPMTDPKVPLSNSSGSRLKQKAGGSEICDLVHQLLDAGRNFNKVAFGPYSYNPLDGPNSNSVTEFLSSGLGFSTPPMAPGWSYFYDHPIHTP